jgi:hypothetical protein
MSAEPIETSFILPGGYRDPAGGVHRHGAMRPVTVREEMRALGDFRVHLRPESFLPVLLARVVTRLGEVAALDAGVFERLPPADLGVLEDLYRFLNGYPPLAARSSDAARSPE